ncbi:XrtA/PEP-CTERM system histidine kinase PrsK [Desulfonema magnum]|nr:XrtA/PEP-CTERM system histidine kinase PrsK [Desulfonema magnum]
MRIPLLAGEYLYLVYHTTPRMISLVFFSESIFALIWFAKAFWLLRTGDAETSKYKHFFVFEISTGLLVLGIGGYCFFRVPVSYPAGNYIVFTHNNIFFLSNILLLSSAIFSAFRLERFWRSLSPTQRWEYKFLIIGSYLIGCTVCWAVSYRFIYHRMSFDHYLLLSVIFIFAWGLMIYAVVRHRLLNRKLFVSRKVVYASLAPLLFGLYLIVVSLISMVMHYLSLPLPIVLLWLLWIAGLVFIALMIVSGKVRHDVKYFISTHFYINKYEYRDEWLAFSRLLRGAMTETQVVNALHEVMSKSLYTNTMFIWIGDEKQGYRLVFHKGVPIEREKDYHLSADHSLITLLNTTDRYYVKRTKYNICQFPVNKFFPQLSLVLFVPLTIGEHTVGIVGVGPEFTGGLYGQDDFDLLTALCTQAASALMVVRMAEKLAMLRQKEAWNIMSAFILHDVKNAASMLSLIRENATAHLHDPEFQQDMLDAIDDSLKRMNKVQYRLSAVKREIEPFWQEIELCGWLQNFYRKLEKRLQGLTVNFCSEAAIPVKTDTELLSRLMENLLLNALEAGGTGTVVEVKISYDANQQVNIELTDNGPGISAALLPDVLFEPFKTTKAGGSGIGLWQVKRLTAILGGDIIAENSDNGGARFVITLPVEKELIIDN